MEGYNERTKPKRKLLNSRWSKVQDMIQEEMTRNNYCDTCNQGPCCWTTNVTQLLLVEAVENHFTTANKRFFMYQQMKCVLHGHLGHGNRKELPSCVVTGVQELFPDDNENYQGFSRE